MSELRPVDFILGALARHAKECDCGGFCNHAAAVIEAELDRFRVEREQRRNTTAYTPGPWTVNGLVVVALGADRVVHLPSMTDTPVEECRSNARLIAAAPDLLAACKAVRDAFAPTGFYGPEHAMLTAAIKKVEDN
jgi:hypothetical protein